MAYYSYNSLIEFGEKFKESGGFEIKPEKIQGIDFEIVNGTSLSSGLNGAALGFGIIVSVCIYSIVHIETKIYSKSN
ncbi:hypothetical protein [Algoriphagus aquaeductus]|nr:hypothetical protein [Algoriphagus aquaeductus]